MDFTCRGLNFQFLNVVTVGCESKVWASSGLDVACYKGRRVGRAYHCYCLAGRFTKQRRVESASGCSYLTKRCRVKQACGCCCGFLLVVAKKKGRVGRAWVCCFIAGCSTKGRRVERAFCFPALNCCWLLLQKRAGLDGPRSAASLLAALQKGAGLSGPLFKCVNPGTYATSCCTSDPVCHLGSYS